MASIAEPLTIGSQTTVRETTPYTIDGLDWEPGCQSALGCDLAAEWVLQVSCCKSTTLLCSAHLKRWLDAERRVVKQGSVYCRECGTVIAGWAGFARWWQL